jgi:hypothetical protein
MAKKPEPPKFGTADEFTAGIEAPPRAFERNERRGPGRPIGKRSNPSYRQYTALIRIDVHSRALEKLRRTTARPDFGEYVESLILQDLQKS